MFFKLIKNKNFFSNVSGFVLTSLIGVSSVSASDEMLRGYIGQMPANLALNYLSARNAVPRFIGVLQDKIIPEVETGALDPIDALRLNQQHNLGLQQIVLDKIKSNIETGILDPIDALERAHAQGVELSGEQCIVERIKHNVKNHIGGYDAQQAIQRAAAIGFDIKEHFFPEYWTVFLDQVRVKSLKDKIDTLNRLASNTAYPEVFNDIGIAPRSHGQSLQQWLDKAAKHFRAGGKYAGQENEGNIFKRFIVSVKLQLALNHLDPAICQAVENDATLENTDVKYILSKVIPECYEFYSNPQIQLNNIFVSKEVINGVVDHKQSFADAFRNEVERVIKINLVAKGIQDHIAEAIAKDLYAGQPLKNSLLKNLDDIEFRAVKLRAMIVDEFIKEQNLIGATRKAEEKVLYDQINDYCKNIPHKIARDLVVTMMEHNKKENIENLFQNSLPLLEWKLNFKAPEIREERQYLAAEIKESRDYNKASRVVYVRYLADDLVKRGLSNPRAKEFAQHILDSEKQEFYECLRDVAVQKFDAVLKYRNKNIRADVIEHFVAGNHYDECVKHGQRQAVSAIYQEKGCSQEEASAIAGLIIDGGCKDGDAIALALDQDDYLYDNQDIRKAISKFLTGKNTLEEATIRAKKEVEIRYIESLNLGLPPMKIFGMAERIANGASRVDVIAGAKPFKRGDLELSKELAQVIITKKIPLDEAKKEVLKLSIKARVPDLQENHLESIVCLLVEKDDLTPKTALMQVLKDAVTYGEGAAALAWDEGKPIIDCLKAIHVQLEKQKIETKYPHLQEHAFRLAKQIVHDEQNIKAVVFDFLKKSKYFKNNLGKVEEAFALVLRDHNPLSIEQAWEQLCLKPLMDASKFEFADEDEKKAVLYQRAFDPKLENAALVDEYRRRIILGTLKVDCPNLEEDVRDFLVNLMVAQKPMPIHSALLFYLETKKFIGDKDEVINAVLHEKISITEASQKYGILPIQKLYPKLNDQEAEIILDNLRNGINGKIQESDIHEFTKNYFKNYHDLEGKELDLAYEIFRKNEFVLPECVAQAKLVSEKYNVLKMGEQFEYAFQDRKANGLIALIKGNENADFSVQDQDDFIWEVCKHANAAGDLDHLVEGLARYLVEKDGLMLPDHMMWMTEDQRLEYCRHLAIRMIAPENVGDDQVLFSLSGSIHKEMQRFQKIRAAFLGQKIKTYFGNENDADYFFNQETIDLMCRKVIYQCNWDGESNLDVESFLIEYFVEEFGEEIKIKWNLEQTDKVDGLILSVLHYMKQNQEIWHASYEQVNEQKFDQEHIKVLESFRFLPCKGAVKELFKRAMYYRAVNGQDIDPATEESLTALALIEYFKHPNVRVKLEQKVVGKYGNVLPANMDLAVFLDAMAVLIVEQGIGKYCTIESLCDNVFQWIEEDLQRAKSMKNYQLDDEHYAIFYWNNFFRKQGMNWSLQKALAGFKLENGVQLPKLHDHLLEKVISSLLKNDNAPLVEHYRHAKISQIEQRQLISIPFCKLAKYDIAALMYDQDLMIVPALELFLKNHFQERLGRNDINSVAEFLHNESMPLNLVVYINKAMSKFEGRVALEDELIQEIYFAISSFIEEKIDSQHVKRLIEWTKQYRKYSAEILGEELDLLLAVMKTLNFIMDNPHIQDFNSENIYRANNTVLMIFNILEYIEQTKPNAETLDLESMNHLDKDWKLKFAKHFAGQKENGDVDPFNDFADVKFFAGAIHSCFNLVPHSIRVAFDKELEQTEKNYEARKEKVGKYFAHINGIHKRYVNDDGNAKIAKLVQCGIFYCHCRSHFGKAADSLENADLNVGVPIGPHQYDNAHMHRFEIEGVQYTLEHPLWRYDPRSAQYLNAVRSEFDEFNEHQYTNDDGSAFYLNLDRLMYNPHYLQPLFETEVPHPVEIDDFGQIRDNLFRLIEDEDAFHDKEGLKTSVGRFFAWGGCSVNVLKAQEIEKSLGSEEVQSNWRRRVQCIANHCFDEDKVAKEDLIDYIRALKPAKYCYDASKEIADNFESDVLGLEPMTLQQRVSYNFALWWKASLMQAGDRIAQKNKRRGVVAEHGVFLNILASRFLSIPCNQEYMNYHGLLQMKVGGVRECFRKLLPEFKKNMIDELYFATYTGQNKPNGNQIALNQWIDWLRKSPKYCNRAIEDIFKYSEEDKVKPTKESMIPVIMDFLEVEKFIIRKDHLVEEDEH